MELSVGSRARRGGLQDAVLIRKLQPIKIRMSRLRAEKERYQVEVVIWLQRLQKPMVEAWRAEARINQKYYDQVLQALRKNELGLLDKQRLGGHLADCFGQWEGQTGEVHAKRVGVQDHLRYSCSFS